MAGAGDGGPESPRLQLLLLLLVGEGSLCVTCTVRGTASPGCCNTKYYFRGMSEYACGNSLIQLEHQLIYYQPNANIYQPNANIEKPLNLANAPMHLGRVLATHNHSQISL